MAFGKSILYNLREKAGLNIKPERETTQASLEIYMETVKERHEAKIRYTHRRQDA